MKKWRKKKNERKQLYSSQINLHESYPAQIRKSIEFLDSYDFILSF